MTDKINILNKLSLLSDIDRKAPLQHGCDFFTFETCLDLSLPIKVIPYGNCTQFSLIHYTRDVAMFICWWTHFVQKDLNGFSGFCNVKFFPVGFTVLNEGL